MKNLKYVLLCFLLVSCADEKREQVVTPLAQLQELNVNILGTNFLTQAAGRNLELKLNVTDNGSIVPTESINVETQIVEVNGGESSIPVGVEDNSSDNIAVNPYDASIASLPLALASNTDDSGSLKSNDPSNLRLDALGVLIDSLKEKDELMMYRFSSSLELLHPFSSNKDSLKAAIKGNSSGGTSLYGTTLTVYNELLAQKSASSFNRAVLLFSDGQPTDSSKEQDLITKIESKEVPVYTIGFGDAAETCKNSNAADVMRKIAQTSGGAYIAVSKADQLQGIFQGLGLGLGKAVKNVTLDLTNALQNQPDCVDIVISIRVILKNLPHKVGVKKIRISSKYLP